jgi:integrase
MATTFNPTNEKMKHKYFVYLKEAKQLSKSTVSSVSKAIIRYEEFTKFEDLGKFNKQKAVTFKSKLAGTKNKAKGEPLSKSTLLHTLNPLKEFFKWLGYQEGYKSKINLHDIDYLNLSEKDTREAKSSGQADCAEVDEIKKAIFAINPSDDIARRNQALIAFTLLTGIRDGAIITLKLKHIDVHKKLVMQDPKEVKTKFSKRIDTYFFPVGDDVEQVVLDWIAYLKTEKQFDGKCPLFPKTLLAHDADDSFICGGLSREHWQSITPLRDIFKHAFTAAGLRYYNPHSFRNTLVRLGERICTTPEEFKAWSQNLGHESPLTTFTSYGYVPTYKQGELVKNAGKSKQGDALSKILSLLEKDKQ